MNDYYVINLTSLRKKADSARNFSKKPMKKHPKDYWEACSGHASPS